MSSLEIPPTGGEQPPSPLEPSAEGIPNPERISRIADGLIEDREGGLRRRFNIGRDVQVVGTGVVLGTAGFLAAKILGTGEPPPNLTEAIILSSIAGAAIHEWGKHLAYDARDKLEALRRKFGREEKS